MNFIYHYCSTYCTTWIGPWGTKSFWVQVNYVLYFCGPCPLWRSCALSMMAFWVLPSQWHLFCVLQSFFSPPIAFRSVNSFFTCATLLRAFSFLDKPLVKVPDKTSCFTGPSFNSSSTSLSVKFVLCLSYLLKQVDLYLACFSFKGMLLFFYHILQFGRVLYKKTYKQMQKMHKQMNV